MYSLCQLLLSAAAPPCKLRRGGESLRRGFVLVQAVLTKYHKLGGLYVTEIYVSRIRAWKSKIRVPGRLVLC